MMTARIVAGLVVAAMVVASGAFFARGQAAANAPAEPGTTKVPVTFTGGYGTDPRDGGRPVMLIAAALGVTPDKFREAFSGVTPARGAAPEPAQVQRNKQALMRVLAPLGVTNDRLDEVSNYYRYRPQNGELWTHRPAKAFAKVKDGLVTGFEIPDAGAGYSSPPTVTLKDMPATKVAVSLSFGTDLQKNGSVATLTLENATTLPAK